MDGLVALGTIFIPGLAEVKDLPQAAIAKGGFEKPRLLLYDNAVQPNAARADAVRRRAGAHHNALAIHSPLLCFVRPTRSFLLEEGFSRQSVANLQRFLSDNDT